MTKETANKWIQGVNITLILTIISLIVYGVRKNDLTFDNQQQKQDAIRFYSKDHPITNTQVQSFTHHTKDNDIHMTFQEKVKFSLMEDRQIQIQKNQVKIGQDLEEIKTLIKNRY